MLYLPENAIARAYHTLMVTCDNQTVTTLGENVSSITINVSSKNLNRELSFTNIQNQNGSGYKLHVYEY